MKFSQLLFFFLVISLLSCKGDNVDNTKSKKDATNIVEDVKNGNYGVVVLSTSLTIDEVIEKITDAIESNENMTLFTNVDYNGNRTLLFGNPHVGKPIINTNSKTALDLPLKLTVYNEDGKTKIAYNNSEYLVSRYDIIHDQNLKTMDNWFKKHVSILSKDYADRTAEDINFMEGIVEIKSPYNYNDTKLKISEEINKKSGTNIIEIVDHSDNAEKINQKIDSSTLYLFNIEVDCQELIDISPSIAVDLPTKILVYQSDNNNVMVAYNHPYYLAKRHGINNTEPVLERINKVLGNITTLATK